MLGLYKVIPILIFDFFRITGFNIITTLWYVTLKTVKEFEYLIKKVLTRETGLLVNIRIIYKKSTNRN